MNKSQLRIFEIVDNGNMQALRGDFIITMPLDTAKKTGRLYSTESCDEGYAEVVGLPFAVAVNKGDSIDEVASILIDLGTRLKMRASATQK